MNIGRNHPAPAGGPRALHGPANQSRIPTPDDLLNCDPAEFAAADIAAVNLAAAAGLPGAENLDIEACQATLDHWAQRVLQETDRLRHIFLRDEAQFGNSEAMFRMIALVQVLKKDLGVRYNQDRLLPADVACPLGFLDSGDLFIHGMLRPPRAGTCNSIPVLVTAVGRRLGYPLYLATNPCHVYVKWRGADGEQFNVEASCAGGMNSYPDEHYRDWPVPMNTDMDTGYYLRPLTPREEMGLFVISRAWVFEAHERFEEALRCYARACALSPDEPMYLRWAAKMVGTWLRERDNLRQKFPRRLSRPERGWIWDRSHKPDELLPRDEAALASSILGRYYEICGRVEESCALYAESRRLAPHRRDHRSNFERSWRRLQATRGLPDDVYPVSQVHMTCHASPW